MAYNYCKNGAFRSSFALKQGGGLAFADFDDALANLLTVFFKNSTVADFGAGIGWYTRYLRKKDIQCIGYDGIRKVAQITDGEVKYLDLTKPAALEIIFDWILCLEVGEHIPKQYEKTFIQNLHQFNKKGIVLSWALPRQDGTGHINCKINDDVRTIFLDLGYKCDWQWEKRMRETVKKAWWLNNTIMVFRRDVVY